MLSSRFALIFSLLVFLEGVLGNSASAQQSAKDYFEPIVSHHQFTLLVRDLDLPRDQRLIVEMVFADYLDALESLAAEADARADQVGRRTVNDALAGRAIVEPAELRRLRLAVLDAYQSQFEAVDREFQKLLQGVRSVLTEAQRRGFDDRVREFRRSVLLHPRHAERNFHEYAGDGVDVLLLVEAAAAPGGELHGFLNPDAADTDASLSETLRRYEYALDRFLVESALEYRHARMELRKARISRDPAVLRDAERVVLDLWNRLYTLNAGAVEEIAEWATMSVGEDAGERWRQRFHEACFAWMFARSGPDRQFEWLMAHNLSPEQRRQVQDIYDEYRARRFVLASRAIALMIRARAEHHAIVHSMMDPVGLTGPTRRLYDDLLRNSGEMATLDAQTSTDFERLLTQDQLRSFRRILRR